MRTVCFDIPVTVSRIHVAREAVRRARRTRLDTGEQIHQLRLDAGASLTDLADVVGVHRSHIARIEAGRAHASLDVLTAIGVALGAEFSVRLFAVSGPRLRDRFQAAMVEALLREIDPRWTRELEVPISHPARGVIDLVLSDPRPVFVAMEFQSEIRRLEEQLRWAAEKADGLAARIGREGRIPIGARIHRVLVLRSTTATRDLGRRYEATLASAYPARTAEVTRALLSCDAVWPGSGLAWMDVDGGGATLMRQPPRGVSLGR